MEVILTMEEVHITTVGLRMETGMEQAVARTTPTSNARQEGPEPCYLLQVQEDMALRQRLF